MINVLLSIVLLMNISLHDFHVTHTTVHYNSKSESIEITVKFAIEDIEQALMDKGLSDLGIGTAKEKPETNEYIFTYFKEHLKILPNNKSRDYSWIGKETSKDLHDLYAYFEITNCNQNGTVESLIIENSLFTDIQLDQANIVLIEFQRDTHTLTFTRDQSRKEIKLNQTSN